MKCILVAHPDDETLFGSALAESCDIICCSIPKRNPIRALKFYDACKVLGCRGIILPVQENPPYPLDLSMLDLSPYDHVITHNHDGEYGHAHHKQLHQYVLSNFQGKKGFFAFNGGQHKIPIDWKRKLETLKCYDHTNDIDGMPKWQALLNRYPISQEFEYYDGIIA